MKVAVTATGLALDAAIDPRFGRCAHFVFVETDDMSFQPVENMNGALGGGAGIQSAQLIAQMGAKAVLTGSCGPNAFRVLSASGIEVISGCSGTVMEAIESFKSGRLRAASAANVANHSGLRGGRR